jgi:hypothetical protein
VAERAGGAGAHAEAGAGDGLPFGEGLPYGVGPVCGAATADLPAPGGNGADRAGTPPRDPWAPGAGSPVDGENTGTAGTTNGEPEPDCAYGGGPYGFG